ncbi:hypothetical protein MASR2M79_14870 [Aminivibrio sp.]
MKIRTLSSILLVLTLFFFSSTERIAWAAPFSSSPEFRFMQRYRTRRDQRSRLKTIETCSP